MVGKCGYSQPSGDVLDPSLPIKFSLLGKIAFVPDLLFDPFSFSLKEVRVIPSLEFTLSSLRGTLCDVTFIPII